MKFFLFITTMFFCANSMAASKEKISQNLVAGVIGCPADSILISDYSASSKNPFMVSAHTFSATCNDVKYYCSYLYPTPATCKVAADHVPKTEEDEIKKEKEMELWKTDLLDKAIRNWVKPEYLDGMVDSEIDVTVDHRGKLLNLRWVTPTKIRAIDRSIVTAFKKAQPFRAPPVTTPTVTVTITFPAKQ
jgi:TonB family protein